jgi:hypothetical protein
MGGGCGIGGLAGFGCGDPFIHSEPRSRYSTPEIDIKALTFPPDHGDHDVLDLSFAPCAFLSSRI